MGWKGKVRTAERHPGSGQGEMPWLKVLRCFPYLSALFLNTQSLHLSNTSLNKKQAEEERRAGERERRKWGWKNMISPAMKVKITVWNWILLEYYTGMGEKGKGEKERKIYYLRRNKILMRKRTVQSISKFQINGRSETGLVIFPSPLHA